MVKSKKARKQKIRIKIKSYDHKIIDDAVKFIINTAESTGAIVVGPVPLPTKIDKYTLNRSTFVHKDARDQYEIRTHRRLLDIKEINQKTIDSLTNVELPSGVDVEIKII